MGKLIDLDDLKNEYEQRIDYLLSNANEPALAGAVKGCMDIAELLIPTVDAVPVTRCRDCRRHKYGRFCDRTGVKACPNDFCSYAEPKEEDNGRSD